jgi:hypothetical protein
LQPGYECVFIEHEGSFGGKPDPRDQVHRYADRFPTGFVGGEFLGVDV